jgi:uncharacterized protein DUF4259
MGTWGSGPFDNDVAADLLGYLSEHDPGQRREILEQVMHRAREHKEVHWMDSPSEVVGAVAVLAASLPGGEGEVTEIARLQFDAGAIVLPEVKPELVDAALEALQAAAGQDGGWLDGWVTRETAAGVKRTTDQIASVFYRYQRRNDQELPWED